MRASPRSLGASTHVISKELAGCDGYKRARLTFTGLLEGGFSDQLIWGDRWGLKHREFARAGIQLENRNTFPFQSRVSTSPLCGLRARGAVGARCRGPLGVAAACAARGASRQSPREETWELAHYPPLLARVKQTDGSGSQPLGNSHSFSPRESRGCEEKSSLTATEICLCEVLYLLYAKVAEPRSFSW